MGLNSGFKGLNFHKAPWYKRECNSIQTHKTITTFHAPIFCNFTNSDVLNSLIYRYVLTNCVQSDNKYWEREKNLFTLKNITLAVWTLTKLKMIQ
jgi:hypothetical protein